MLARPPLVPRNQQPPPQQPPQPQTQTQPQTQQPQPQTQQPQTQTQQRMQQFSFGPDPDSAVAAKKRTIRLVALARYRQKKIDRINNPVIRYKSRKKIADNRPRVMGRFIKTDNTVRAEPNALLEPSSSPPQPRDDHFPTHT